MDGVDTLHALVCAHCSDPKSLQPCGGCKVVYYCSPHCKQMGAAEHGEDCASVNSLSTQLLEFHNVADTPIPGELGSFREEHGFTALTGILSRFYPALQYLKIRSRFVAALRKIAERENTAEAWSRVLYHELELLRLDRWDFSGTRMSVVFTLLRLGRDDQCVSFIKHFQDPATAMIHFDDLPELETERGDWIYRSDADCRFEDVMAAFDVQPDNVLFEFMVALLICKLRIIAEHNARKLELAALRQSTLFKNLKGADDILGVMQRKVVGDQSVVARVKRQVPMADRLMVGITKRNIQAMVNDESLDHLPPMDKAVFQRARRFLRVTPGAKNRAEKWITTGTCSME